MKFFKITLLTLVLLGAINWGLVGLFNFDLVAALFGDLSFISRAIYILIGSSALISMFLLYSSVINEDIAI